MEGAQAKDSEETQPKVTKGHASRLETLMQVALAHPENPRSINNLPFIQLSLV